MFPPTRIARSFVFCGTKRQVSSTYPCSFPNKSALHLFLKRQFFRRSFAASILVLVFLRASYLSLLYVAQFALRTARVHRCSVTRVTADEQKTRPRITSRELHSNTRHTAPPSRRCSYSRMTVTSSWYTVHGTSCCDVRNYMWIKWGNRSDRESSSQRK